MLKCNAEAWSLRASPLNWALYIIGIMSKLINIAFYSVFGLAAFNWLGWPVQLRFSDAHLNYYFITMLCVLLPIVLFFKMLISGYKSNYLVALISSGVLGLGCLVVGNFAYLDAAEIKKSNIDLSFEKIDEIRHGNTFFRLYRTNGGATTSYGLILRSESKDLFGVKLVDEIFSKYKASEAEMTLVGDRILLKIQPYLNENIDVVSVKI
ncbi:hypothetical protein CGJ08_23930 [Vibrio parahaemolyticus]|nr:hypothetical protein CGJ08_23930 [Vibrio parahaemolyticus]